MKKTIMVLIVVFSLLCTTALASATTTSPATASIISPNSTEMITIGDVEYPSLKTDNLTISVKVTDQRTYNIAVYKQSLTATDAGEAAPRVPVGEAENFTGTGTLSYYTRSIAEVDAEAIYTVEVKLVSNGTVGTDVMANRSVIVIAPDAANTSIFNSPSTSPSQFIQNLLKSIFN